VSAILPDFPLHPYNRMDQTLELALVYDLRDYCNGDGIIHRQREPRAATPCPAHPDKRDCENCGWNLNAADARQARQLDAHS